MIVVRIVSPNHNPTTNLYERSAMVRINVSRVAVSINGLIPITVNGHRRWGVPYNGEVRTIKELARSFGLSERTLYGRLIYHRWPIEKALKTKPRFEYHGMKDTVEYGIWAKMLCRCRNENGPAYKDYGGRGINVCDRWLLFSNFYADMGERPSPKHSLDR